MCPSPQRRPTVREQRKIIAQVNDGSQPAEPSQRCMQIIFEAWLKEKVLTKSHIKSRFGWKYLFHIEDQDGVVATFTDVQGKIRTVRSKYLIGCDGGSSRVRKTAGIKMVGGQMYVPPDIRINFMDQVLIYKPGLDQLDSTSCISVLDNLLRSSTLGVSGIPFRHILGF